MGNDKDKLIDRCLVLVKIYGNKPIKLFIIIKINNEMNIKLKLLFFFIIILNSLYNKFIKFLNKKFMLLGKNQKFLGIINIKIIKINQFKDKEIFIILVDGSNIENKFVIIFNYKIFF